MGYRYVDNPDHRRHNYIVIVRGRGMFASDCSAFVLTTVTGGFQAGSRVEECCCGGGTILPKF